MLGFRRVLPPPNTGIAQMLRILTERGFNVEVGIAEDVILAPGETDVTHDLYVLKSHSDFWLSMAAAFDQQGAYMVNSFSASLGMQNKVAIADRLATAGVPAPRTWLTGDLNRLSELVAAHPVIIKPNRGLKGREVFVVRDRHDLAGIAPPTSLVLAQEYIESDGVLKVYVIGDEVFCVRRAGPLGLGGPPEPYVISPEVRRLALACGRIFGLQLYGVDVVDGANGPVVVDVNYFPSFRGVSDAGECLAAALEAACYSAPQARIGTAA